MVQGECYAAAVIFSSRRQCLGALPISVPPCAQHFQSDPTDPAEPVALGRLSETKKPALGSGAKRRNTGQVAGEHAPAATDRAKSFQADDEGSIPFTRSIFKIKHLSRIIRELNATERHSGIHTGE